MRALDCGEGGEGGLRLTLFENVYIIYIYIYIQVVKKQPHWLYIT